MQHARNIAADTKSDDERRKKATERLDEGKRGGPKPPQSGPIEITKIEVIANKKLWNMYYEERKKLGVDENIPNNPLEKVTWASQDDNYPVPKDKQDDKSGEAHLVHGTAYADSIVKSGFKPELGANKNTGKVDSSGSALKPTYGMLGQGTYFGDTISKAMTYADETTEKDTEVILARVLLGNPKKMHGMAQPGGNLRDQSRHDIKQGRNSVYSQGFNVNKNPFASGSGTNEFSVKNAAQMYPEFRIYYHRKKEGE
jgi:hypothetical protein